MVRAARQVLCCDAMWRRVTCDAVACADRCPEPLQLQLRLRGQILLCDAALRELKAKRVMTTLLDRCSRLLSLQPRVQALAYGLGMGMSHALSQYGQRVITVVRCINWQEGHLPPARKQPLFKCRCDPEVQKPVTP